MNRDDPGRRDRVADQVRLRPAAYRTRAALSSSRTASRTRARARPAGTSLPPHACRRAGSNARARAFREGEVPAHRRTGHVGVEFRQLRAVDEIDAPFALHMRTAVEHVVRMRVGVAANPEVDRPWMRREKILERLRLRLVAEEVEIGSALRRAVRAVISAGPERAVRIAAHALVVAGADRGLA